MKFIYFSTLNNIKYFHYQDQCQAMIFIGTELHHPILANNHSVTSKTIAKHFNLVINTNDFANIKKMRRWLLMLRIQKESQSQVKHIVNKKKFY